MHRTLTLTLKELLDELIMMSGGGHPGDYIDEKTAGIAIITVNGSKRIQVSWEDSFETDEEREEHYREMAEGAPSPARKKRKKKAPASKKKVAKVIQFPGRRKT